MSKISYNFTDMKSKLSKIELKTLNLELKNLQNRIESALRNYRQYQSFFRKEDGREAVLRAHLRYRQHLRTGSVNLEQEMFHNRRLRNLLEDQIRDIKKKIKQVSEAHSETVQAERLVMQEELNVVRAKVEESLTESGVEISSVAINRYFRTPKQLCLRVRIKMPMKGLLMYTAVRELTENMQFVRVSEEIETTNYHRRTFVDLRSVVTFLKQQ